VLNMELKRVLPAAAAAVLLLAGCAPAEPPTAPAASGTPEASSNGLEQGRAMTTPAATGNGPAASPPGTQDGASPASLKLYYVAVDDAGGSGETIGCGDSLVATDTEPVSTQDRVHEALERLLADKKQFLGESGLYNALYQSKLSFVRASTDADTVTVELEGQLKSGGTCDDPRIERQLEQTAATAAGTGSSVVLVNGVRVEELLSGK
jgi:hypothetical protein